MHVWAQDPKHALPNALDPVQLPQLQRTHCNSRAGDGHWSQFTTSASVICAPPSLLLLLLFRMYNFICARFIYNLFVFKYSFLGGGLLLLLLVLSVLLNVRKVLQ